jgi:tetratricopeptide (TPR) repeat protein
MKILITGSNGFIANNIKSYFIDHELTCISRKNFDLRNTDETNKFFKNKYFDVVIHCAISGGYRLVEDSKDIVYDNIKLAMNLMINSFLMNLFKTLYSITLITLLNVHISYAESNKNYRPNDFLTKSLRNAHDTVKLLKLFTIGEKLLTTKPDSSIVIFNVILTNARKINNQPFVARSYGSMGTAHLYRANYNESEKFYKLALEEWTKLNNLKMIGGNLSNLGNVYWYLGKFDKAIDYYIKSMNIRNSMTSMTSRTMMDSMPMRLL